ncbi:cytochrome c1 [Sphingomonas sp. GlSt437]|uniref:cytochrome c1 n=1 Tax=Sphingomonas sp. GlSt437 TaxID=3389970 RepID=UPI003A8861ED
MLRAILGLVGAGFVLVLGIALYSSISGVITDPPVKTAQEEFHLHPKNVAFPSDGVFGKYDLAQLQRGFKVYREVCSNCHSLSHVAFRDLTKIGYSVAQVKKIASDWDAKNKQPTLDPKTGERSDRGNTPADHFPIVYYPGQGNPPDLSLITKARHGGGAYVYSLLTGYADQNGYKNPPGSDLPQGVELLKRFPDAKTPDGLYFNPYFANLNIAMPPPLSSDGQVTYDDGTKSTVDQNAKDVAAFLTWAAEPELPARHALGYAVIGFLLFFLVLVYGAYRNIWRDTAH